jgi:pimeloyl-ACP methyl ester carboxylesterase
VYPPTIRYAKSGDINIAYQVVGEGPFDLVYVPGFVSNIDLMWEELGLAAFLERLASFSRLILFDKRGTGLSDPVPLDALPGLEQRMDDVRAVMDAVGSDQAALLGHSEGGNMCTLFAATYPQRTRALVLVGSYAKRIRSEEYPWAPTYEQRMEEIAETERAWGSSERIEKLAPSKVDDEAFQQWTGRYWTVGQPEGRGRAPADELDDRRSSGPAVHPGPDVAALPDRRRRRPGRGGEVHRIADPRGEARRAPRDGSLHVDG